jgi:hypothetical protein
VEQIEHRGWAGLFIAEGDDEIEVIDPALLEKLNNLTVFDEEISVFLQDGNESQRKLYEIGVRGGLPKIQFDSKSKSIYCSIPYISPRMLNDAEVRTLREYSDSQLIDGFGSNPIDTPIIGEGYFVQLGNA